MQVEVEFYDEFGNELVFPTWPGGSRGMPQISKLKPNRLIYSHQFLASAGHSLSGSDKIKDVKRIIENCTPMLNKTLAISIHIDKFLFNNIPLEDDQRLSEYQVRVNTSRATLTGHTLEAIKATTHVVMNLTSSRGNLISIKFDKFNRETVTCADLMERIAKQEGIAASAQHIIREYPSVRPVKLVPSERILGFPGKSERGIWVIPPHNGPVFPASVPTPPEMTLRMSDSTTIDLLDEEDTWVSIFKLQPVWEGEIENYSGAKETISIRIEPPAQAVWKTVRIPGKVASRTIHPQIKAPVTLQESPIQTAVVAEPDVSPVQGFGHLKSGVVAQDVDKGSAYLPSPEEIAWYKKDCNPFELGKSFGTGVITVGNNAPVPCTYRIKIGYPTNKIFMAGFIKGPTEDSDCFVIVEGDLAKGISETYYLRGSVYYQDVNAKTPDTLKWPFCVFQLTIGSTVPEVVYSPMGIRYAGLKTRSFTVFGWNFKLEKVGDALEFSSIDALIPLLPSDGVRIVLAHLLLEEPGGSVTLKPIIIYWNFPVEGEEAFCPTYRVTKLNPGRKVIVAKEEAELRQSLYELGKPLGFGLPADEVVERMSLRDREGLPKKANVAPSGGAPTKPMIGASGKSGSKAALGIPGALNLTASGRKGSDSGETSPTPRSPDVSASRTPPSPNANAKRKSNVIGPSETRYIASATSNRPVEFSEATQASANPYEEAKERMSFAMNVESLMDTAHEPANDAIDALSLLDAIYKRKDEPDSTSPKPSKKEKEEAKKREQELEKQFELEEKREKELQKSTSATSVKSAKAAKKDSKDSKGKRASAAAEEPAAPADSYLGLMSDDPDPVDRYAGDAYQGGNDFPLAEEDTQDTNLDRSKSSKKSKKKSTSGGQEKEGCVIA